VSSLLYASAEPVSTGYTYGMGHLYYVVLTELASAPILIAIMYSRGWRLADFTLGIGKQETALGVGIAATTWIVGGIVMAIFGALFFSQSTGGGEPYRPVDPPDWVAIYLLSVINPVFEEVFVCGYVMKALAPRFGMTTAINVSVIIRASYHLYQGIAAAPYHVSYGLLQAYVFARFGKLWPLIVSHAILDFVALALLIYRA
jgi:uncharacterized protein